MLLNYKMMSTPFHLTNKTILITGASSGIGRQVAISCSSMGAKVIITGRDEKRLTETFSSLQGEGHMQVTCDLLNETSRNEMLDKIPAVDGFVHSAGIVLPVPVKFIVEKHLRNVMGVNFESAAYTVARLLKNKKLADGSSLVFFSSISVNYPYAGGALYTASKGAIEAYSKNLAIEILPKRMRCNVVVPAMVRTPLYEETKTQSMYRSADEYESKYPLGLGMPEDVANACIYLLSDAARWVTGINLVLDGGFSIVK
jgi:NAD(P)-dependent dehydrogenase (short-subunit alcohol dehydrogenase family)